MLASITPLGERGRDQRFALTVTAYGLGSVLAATLLGAVLGGLGWLLVGRIDAGARLGVGAVLALGAAALDRRGGAIPSWHRQVNEDWLATYRGWVYGLGFGVQLGLGVVTIVTTASVYLLWAGVFLAADPVIGGVAGATFGLVRALPVVLSARLRQPAAVGARVGRFDRWDGRFRTVTVTTELIAAAAVLLMVVR